MTYKGKEITESEITVDIIKEILKDYLPSLINISPYDFLYHKKFNDDINLLDSELILEDFIKYIHSKKRRKEIEDVEICIKKRIRDKRYYFKSAAYRSFLRSEEQRRKNTLKSKIEARIQAAPEGHQAYDDQLKDPRWGAFRSFVLIVRKRKCEICGSTDNLQVHHPKYIEGRKAWEYTCNEVQVLCRDCHRKVHNLDSSHD